MPRWHQCKNRAGGKTKCAGWISVTPPIGVLALVSTLVVASPSFAQKDSQAQPTNNPPSPFQEKITQGFVKLPGGLWTPERQTERVEAGAKEREDTYGYPIERARSFVIWQAENAAEFAAMARYSLLLLSVVTQKTEELPLKRLYLRLPDRQVSVLKISSWRVNVDQALITARMFGPYREDGFYLIPTSAYLRPGQIQADFAVNRSGLPVMEFPAQAEWVPGWLKEFQNPDPEPGALPTLKMLQAFIKRRTSGFPIPDALPWTAYAREPIPKSLPQAVPESKKPSSLKDLFKK